MTDLWPEDIGVTDVKAPVAILKEQAAALGRRTKNVVVGIVVTETISTGQFGYSFYLDAPLLQFSYKLFKIRHGVELYPVRINPDEDIRKEIAAERKLDLLLAKTESDFLNLLSLIFRSEKTRKVLQAIISQSR